MRHQGHVERSPPPPPIVSPRHAETKGRVPRRIGKRYSRLLPGLHISWTHRRMREDCICPSGSFLLFLDTAARLRASPCILRRQIVHGPCHNTRPTMLHRRDDKAYLSVSGDSAVRDKYMRRPIRGRSWNSPPCLSSFALFTRTVALRKIYPDISRNCTCTQLVREYFLPRHFRHERSRRIYIYIISPASAAQPLMLDSDFILWQEDDFGLWGKKGLESCSVRCFQIL